MTRVLFVVLYLLLAALLAAVAFNYYLIDQFARPVPLLDGALSWPSQTAGLGLGAAALVAVVLIAFCHVRAAWREVAAQPGSTQTVKRDRAPAKAVAAGSSAHAPMRERAVEIGQDAARVAAQFHEIRAQALQLSESQVHQAREIGSLSGALARLRETGADKLAQRAKNLEATAAQASDDAAQVARSLAEVAGQVRALREVAAKLAGN